ncbi:asparaginase domain-containing protein [Dietzia aerolata]|uniref:asparaginase domain-containing protein n=1 Tax=Dietzia aerolata TaxID=595984 RepID=UPI003641F7EA
MICTTGGTITASTTPDGAVLAGGSEAATTAMLDGLRAVLPGEIRVSARQILDGDSSTFGPAEWDTMVAAVADIFDDPEVSGVVITHGTDTLEESAIALDLHHDDPRPVALTGAQLAADHPEADGPANLLDAVLLAADPVSRDLGVLVVLGRAILQARGAQMAHHRPRRLRPQLPEQPVEQLPPGMERPVLGGRARFSEVRVDVLACSPGSDATALRACVDAGARGLVLEGTGSGNLPHSLAMRLRSSQPSGPTSWWWPEPASRVERRRRPTAAVVEAPSWPRVASSTSATSDPARPGSCSPRCSAWPTTPRRRTRPHRPERPERPRSPRRAWPRRTSCGNAGPDSTSTTDEVRSPAE